MHGPRVLVDSLAVATVKDEYRNTWQYFPQSDRHSKLACWGVMFDLLTNCALLRQHIEQGKVGFGINHEMRDFRSGKKKDLDLVICTPGSGELPSGKKGPREFRDLMKDYGVVLDTAATEELARLPELRRVPVGTVHLALEAKACMTAHVRALPRLYDELNSTHQTIHGSSNHAIAAGLAVINMAVTFISPPRNRFNLRRKAARVSKHTQPHATLRAIDKMKEIPRRHHHGVDGFDAMGILVLNMTNDGGPVEIVTTSPAPAPSEVIHYDQMVRRIQSLYESRFSSI